MPSRPSPLADLFADLARAFAALGVRWYVFGAQAAILHGAVRLTADVDVTVDLGQHATSALVAALGQAGFELRVEDPDGFVESTRVLPLIHRSSRIPVDVVLAGPGLEELFFSRVEHRSIGGVDVPIASAEDISRTPRGGAESKRPDQRAGSPPGPRRPRAGLKGLCRPLLTTAAARSR